MPSAFNVIVRQFHSKWAEHKFEDYDLVKLSPQTVVVKFDDSKFVVELGPQCIKRMEGIEVCWVRCVRVSVTKLGFD